MRYYNSLNMNKKPLKKVSALCCAVLFLIFICTESVDFKNYARKDSKLNLKINFDQNTYKILSQSSTFILAIDELMKKVQIKNNNQYQNCFNLDEISILDQKVMESFELGRQLSEANIQKYPEMLMSFVRKNFKKQSLQCFMFSNDLNLLLSSYNVKNFIQLNKAFQNYSDQHFSLVHEAFVILIQRLKQKNPIDLADTIDKFLTQIFKKNLSGPNSDEWGIQAFNPQIGVLPYYGITNSNGLIGAISDRFPFKISKTVLAGAYDKYGRGRVDNIVQTMNVMDLDLLVNGVKYPDLIDLNYKQYIDFKKAEFSGSYSILNKASVEYRYLALKNSPGTFYLQAQVTAHEDILVDAKNAHRVPDYLNDVQKQYENIPNKQTYHVISTKATTKTNKIDIVLSSTFFVDDDSKKFMIGQNYEHQDWDSNVHYHTLNTIKVPKGEVFKFYLVSALISSEHHQDPKNQAIRLLLKVASTRPEIIKNNHYQLWQTLWKNDIIIQGNSEDQKIVRSMIYHFYSFINEFKSYGLSPMGLSGLGYNGHVFWDMDLWMYPGILILNPKLAKSLIEYRYDRLQAAKNNAFLNGYKGVMFPWESSKSGDQECPVWAAPGPLEHHITGTVAVAAWKYYCVTKDRQWLQTKGKPIIEGAAQFWESRVQIDQKGYYHINNVVAADQWAQNVDDDAFTNAVAIQSLRIGNKMRQVLGIQPNKNWDDIRSKIVIHKFEDTNVTKQFLTYNGQNIKQADVNLLAFPLKQVTQKEAIARDLQYYQTKVPVAGTPAMTHAIFALLYSRLGDAKKAYSAFKYSYRNNLLRPFSVMAQTQFGNNPYFLTGAGGVLQSVIFGFAGIDITDQGIKTVQTVIPEEWDRVIIKSSVLYTSNGAKNFSDKI